MRAIGIHERVCNRLTDGFYRYPVHDAYHTLSPGLLDAANWFNLHQDQMSEVAISRVLEWYQHQAIEWLRATDSPGISNFCLFGKRGMRSVMEEVEHYEVSIRQRSSRPQLSWTSKGWNRTVMVGSRPFQFIELLSSEELFDEGKTMRQCVGSTGYEKACEKEKIAIFSVRSGEKRVATIEIVMKSGRIRQAFGKANSKLGPLAYQAVNEWQEWVISRDSNLQKQT